MIKQFNLTGIDLDYEAPNMTATQSQQFGELVQALNQKFAGTNYKIMVTILANPEYLKGIKDGIHGFAPNVLAQIASLSQVKSINLMTYDFYGAFNYVPDGTGKTGFIADTYYPNNAPKGSINFATQDSIQTLINLNIPATKISGGIPTYGRALQAIDTTSGLLDPTTGSYSGLYANIPSTALIPRGDLDDASCNQSIYPLIATSCAGSFTYSYIIKNFSSNQFTTVDWKNNASGAFNGTTAYTSKYSPPVTENYNLEVSNLSTKAGGQITSISNGTASIGQLDWMNPSVDKTYNNQSNPSISNIQGTKNLIVKWDSPYTGKSYQCSSFNFINNTHIMINPETGACDIKPLP